LLHSFLLACLFLSQLFTKNLKRKGCKQLHSTMADSPLQALELDESFYCYAKQS